MGGYSGPVCCDMGTPAHQYKVFAMNAPRQVLVHLITYLERQAIAGQDGFIAKARDVLWARLRTAPWISADDTGARHIGANGVCTPLGNQQRA